MNTWNTFWDNPSWQQQALGNSYQDFATAVFVALGLFFVFAVIQWGLLRRMLAFAKTTQTDIDDLIVHVIQTIRPPVYLLLSLYAGIKSLTLPDWLDKTVNVVLIVVVVYQMIVATQTVINAVVDRRMKQTHRPSGAASLAHQLVSLILWSVAFLLILSNLGVNISALVTAFGIGGIAVALAMQNILGDLLSSFALHFDKPFTVGDLIAVGDKTGVVEKIGIKTTRVRSSQGPEIIFSNKELTTVQIQNFRNMYIRRMTLSVGIASTNSTEQLRMLPEIVQSLLKEIPKTVFRRAALRSLRSTSFSLEILYDVLSPDEEIAVQTQHEFLIRLRDAWKQHNITLAD